LSDPFEALISTLPGAGPVTAARLGERGMWTVRDLLMRLPRGYDDLRAATPIAALAGVGDGAVVLVRGTVKRVHVFPRRLLDVFVEEGGEVVRARWFRVPGAMAKSFPRGSAVALAGALRTAGDGTRELISPSVVTAALVARGDAGLGLRPRYALVQGVKGRVLEKMRAAALSRIGAGERGDLLPASARRRLGVSSLGEALVQLHAPPDASAARPEALAPARRRLALEAALVAQTAFLLRRAAGGEAALVVDGPTAEAARAR
jgi:ATP-dependent DNA helicase RecG